MLPLSSAADEAWRWDLIERAPTPSHAALVTDAQGRHVLTSHRMRRVTAQEVLVCLQAPALPAAPGVLEAAQARGEFLLPCLRGLAEQLRSCAQQVEAVLTTWAEEPDEAGGPSARAIVPSLPGVGRKITAWLFAEAAQALSERHYQVLRTQGGVAPVTTHSGKRRQVVMRRGCHPRLRHALYHMARVAAPRDGHCGVVYEALREPRASGTATLYATLETGCCVS